MDQQAWLMHEYDQLRQEILTRAKFLHTILVIATLMALPLSLFALWLFLNDYAASRYTTYLLIIPLFYAGLTFNYQANQMTLEAVANYLATELKKAARQNHDAAILGWDDFYGQHKFNYRLTSFLKVLPLVGPLFMPLFITGAYPSLFRDPLNLSLWVIDIVVLVLALVNFRYKVS